MPLRASCCGYPPVEEKVEVTRWGEAVWAARRALAGWSGTSEDLACLVLVLDEESLPIPDGSSLLPALTNSLQPLVPVPGIEETIELAGLAPR